jgi:hypothetical protein
MANLLELAGYVQKQGDLGRQRGEQSRLASLASQAYTAPRADRQGLLGQMAQTSPDAAVAQQKLFRQGDSDRMADLSRKAKLFVGMAESGNAQAVAALYPQIAQEARDLGLGDIPMEYNDTFLPGLKKFASILDGNGDNPYAGLPSDIQSLKILQSDPTLAALDRERRQAAGMVPKPFETSQGIGWGTPGGGIKLAPIEGVADSTQQAPAQAPQLFAALGQKYGIQPTSVTRTPERNRQVGGVANSYHLTGQAADFVVPQQMKAQFIQDARQNGYEAIDEGDHIHIEPASRRGGGGTIAQPFQKPQAPSDLERRLQMADQMGATAEEKRRMVIGGESGRDAQRISAKDATTARQKITQIRAARQQINSARQAFQKLRGTFSAGLGGQYLPTPEGQAFDRAIANLAPLITAVTRVPGVGAMSDYESRLQNAALPSRGTYEDVTAQQFQDLENLLNTVEAGYNDLLSGGQAAPTAADEADDIDSLLDMYR